MRNTLPEKATPLPDGFPFLMPFRYVEVDGAQEMLVSDNFTQRAYFSYWQNNTSSFTSSNNQNMKIMAEFAQLLDKSSEASQFELRALKAKKAVNDKMFDKDRGVYIDGIGTDHAALHANMLPLAFKLVPEQHIASVLAHVQSRGMACSVYGSQYLMDGLYNAGAEDYALSLLTDTSDRSWFNMIRIGSTITLESWDLKYKNNLNWNHAWGAVPANVITRGLWGIQPKTSGFGIATIKPQLGNLKNSTIKEPTIKGIIHGRFKYIDQKLEVYHIKIPANMVAEFELDYKQEIEVLLNREKVSNK